MRKEKISPDDDQPEWERALRAHISTGAHEVTLFNQSSLAMQLKQILNLGTVEAVRKRILNSREMAERELLSDAQFSEFRALLIGAFAWWGLDNRQPSREQYERYAEAANHVFTGDVVLELNRRTFRDTWAAYSYRQAHSNGDWTDELGSGDYKNRLGRLKDGFQDAFVAFLYALIEGDDPLAYWDLGANRLRRRPAPTAARPVDNSPSQEALTVEHFQTRTGMDSLVDGEIHVADNPDDPSADRAVALVPKAQDLVPISTMKGRPLQTKRRRRVAALIGGAAALALIGTVFAFALTGNDHEQDDDTSAQEVTVETAGVPSTSNPETAYWRFPEMLQAIDQDHCRDVIAPENGESELVGVWTWQADSCLTSGLLVNPDEPAGVWISYHNATAQQADDVTVWVEVPDGWQIVKNSVSWASFSHPNGNSTEASLGRPGISLGSYASNANVAVGAQIQVADPDVACNGQKAEIRAFATSSIGRSEGAQPIAGSTYISCVKLGE
ncbi:hypothetical protein [Leucobacter sp. NPDC077196]|uniref:hypothetical protein n=1 Tax=Leucobacter sp. NPDC077196 TaxID=3154959 RepID=UPI00341E269B